MQLLRRPCVVLVLFTTLVPFATTAFAQTWDRPLANGMTFRMEVQRDPVRTIYGIRWDPKQIRAESRLAGGRIYEPGGYNGRGFVSALVNDAHGVAGFNGDFFQWTPDPGGDPTGFMLSRGTLLSGTGRGDRGWAWVWSESGLPQVAQPEVRVSLQTSAGDWAATTLNGKVAPGGLGVSFEVAGEIYGAGPLTAWVLDLGGKPPTNPGRLQATVREVRRDVARMAIVPGTAVVAGDGPWTERLAAGKVGDQVTIDVAIDGLAEGMAEGMGGGPHLLKDGVYAGPDEPANAPRHPRTAVGKTPDGAIWAVVVDGRQSMSVGATFRETADILRRWGCSDALNLDGGGSSTLHAMGVTLNRPSGGSERPVANGVVLFTRQPRPGIATEVSLQAPVSMRVGEEAVVGLTGAPGNEVVWTAQGTAWIDQDGRLRAFAPGKVVVTALVRARVVRAEIDILTP